MVGKSQSKTVLSYRYIFLRVLEQRKISNLFSVNQSELRVSLNCIYQIYIYICCNANVFAQNNERSKLMDRRRLFDAHTRKKLRQSKIERLRGVDVRVQREFSQLLKVARDFPSVFALISPATRSLSTSSFLLHRIRLFIRRVYRRADEIILFFLSMFTMNLRDCVFFFFISRSTFWPLEKGS